MVTVTLEQLKKQCNALDEDASLLELYADAAEEQVEVGKIAFQGVQRKDLLLQPVRQAFFVRVFLHHPVEDFAHEERHRILVQVPADAFQRVQEREAAGVPEGGTGIGRDLRFHQVQRQEEGHGALRTDPHQETPPSVRLAEGVEDDGMLPELGVAEDDQLNFFLHGGRRPWPGGRSPGVRFRSSAPR